MLLSASLNVDKGSSGRSTKSLSIRAFFFGALPEGSFLIAACSMKPLTVANSMICSTVTMLAGPGHQVIELTLWLETVELRRSPVYRLHIGVAATVFILPPEGKIACELALARIGTSRQHAGPFIATGPLDIEREFPVSPGHKISRSHGQVVQGIYGISMCILKIVFFVPTIIMTLVESESLSLILSLSTISVILI